MGLYGNLAALTFESVDEILYGVIIQMNSLQLHFLHVFIPFSNFYNFLGESQFSSNFKKRKGLISTSQDYIDQFGGKLAGVMQTVVSIAPVSRKGKHQPND